MSYRPQVKADSNGTTQDLPLDAETVQGKTPVFTTTSQTISGVKIYKDTQKFESDINIDGTTTFGPTLLKSYLNSDGTITERGTLLSNKYAPISHSHDRILDYGDTNKTIKIGYSGAGLTASQIGYIAGYMVSDPNNPNEHKIKDISKDVLKSWLGYESAEVATGILGKNTSLDDMTNPFYFWIVFPKGQATNSYNFTADSTSYMCFNVAFIQGGTPGSIRYFKSTTTSSIVQTAKISFSVDMRYIRISL